MQKVAQNTIAKTEKNSWAWPSTSAEEIPVPFNAVIWMKN
jgi:hypothetical protein